MYLPMRGKTSRYRSTMDIWLRRSVIKLVCKSLNSLSQVSKRQILTKVLFRLMLTDDIITLDELLNTFGFNILGV